LPPPPFWTDNVYDTHFGSARSQATGCFVLEIGPEDRAARPGAQVEFLNLTLSPLSSDTDKIMGLQVKLLDDPYYYYVPAHCRKKGADQKCTTAGGFGFGLTAADAVNLRLTILPKLTRCPRCLRTGLSEVKVTTVSATAVREGQGMTMIQCKLCDFAERNPFAIPISSNGDWSHHSRSGGSDSGGGFGGGSSSGGGASGRW
jgi:uncharacterized membrane protein YgcG